MISSASSRKGQNIGGILGKEAIANIGSIFDSAILIKTHDDRHGSDNKIRRYANVINSDGKNFIVKITVKEMSDNRKELTDVEIEDNGGKDLSAYDLKVGRKNTVEGNISEVTSQKTLPSALPNGDDININDLIDFVNTFTEDTIKINGVERKTRNSAGKRIAKTEEGLRAFYEWFGDSKVVDEQGRPLVVYHGTSKGGFTVFNPQNVQTKSRGIGNYFSSKKDISETYGNDIYPVYLNLENPLVVDYKGKYYYEQITVDGKIMGKETGWSSSSIPSITDIAEYAKENGYDGVIAKNIKDTADEMKIIGSPNEKRIKELKKLSDEELFAEYRKVDENQPDDIDGFFKHFGKRRGRDYMAGIIEQSERYAKNESHLIADDYVAFSPNQIKSVDNRGSFSKSNDDIYYQPGGEHRGRGYVGYSMSVNMAEAQANGELPASKAASALGVSTQAIKEVLSPSAWHHASSYYNRVNVYDINPYLALKEGKPIPEDYEDDADEIMANWEAMKNMPKPDKSVEQFYGDAKWLEWGGTRSHPKATEHKYENIKIEKKGSFYTFYLPDGTTVRKKTDSNGTYVVSEEEKAERLERQRQQEEMQHWNNVRHEKLAEISKQYQKEYDAYKKENNLDNPGFAEFEKFQTETNRDGDNIYLQHQKPYSEHKDVGLRRVHLDWISSERKEVAQLQEWDGEKWNVIDTKEDFQNNRWGEPIKERYHFARENEHYQNIVNATDVETIQKAIENYEQSNGGEVRYQTEEVEDQVRFIDRVKNLFKPLAKDVRTFISDLNKVLKGEDTRIRVGNLPFVYKKLGFKDGIVRTNKDIIVKDTIEKHNVPLDVVDILPELYSDPLVVMESRTEKGRLVAVVDAKDEDGNQIIVVISPNEKAIGGYHFIPSFYGKDEFEEFMEINAKENRIKYVKDNSVSDTLQLRSQAFSDVVLNNNILHKSDIVNRTFYQTAYAGSRVDYDEPSLEAIGTGEGAQAHGWGLYYALSKDVAERYRAYFTVDQRLNELVSKYRGLLRDDIIEVATYGKDDTISHYKDLIKGNLQAINSGFAAAEAVSRMKFDNELYEEKISLLKKIDEKDFTEFNKGQVHEVDIPENPYLLDEDLEINQQSETVRKAVRDIMNQYEDYYIASNDYSPNSFGGMTGKMFYKELMNIAARDKGVNGKTEQMKFASQTLEKHGIKGITYDGEQDGRCFVIFNPKDVKVIQKFYQTQAEGGINLEVGGGRKPLKPYKRHPLKVMGQYEPTKKMITLFKGRNPTTLVHEMGHHYLPIHLRLLEKAGKWDKLKPLYKELGISSVEQMGREAEEKLIDMFTSYIYYNEAPNVETQSIFERAKQWMINAYNTVKNFVKPSEEVTKFFDELIAGEENAPDVSHKNKNRSFYERFFAKIMYIYFLKVPTNSILFIYTIFSSFRCCNYTGKSGPPSRR